ncbi:MAG: aminotransferase class V-fold PLP-dependent enzyme [Acidimicrobiaceae bacterium]|nr:aminotransferase class V-fold PLP-dependent enzyme [Acidimicrobiaceae bacterium]
MSLHYFDHAASAPRSARVAERMAPFEHGVVGNPSGSHRAARDARRAIEEARDVVAHLVGAPASGVVFTGGGTESCTLALAGVMASRRGSARSRLLVSAIEHHAVLDAATLCERECGSTITLVGVESSGVLDLSEFAATLDAEVGLVSVMTANNETGVVQPIPVIAEITHAHGGLVHTDAVAGAPWLDLRDATRGADLLSLAAHKLGGPVNSGALVVRGALELAARSPGGGQERGWRGGTVDVAAAVGLAAALEESAEQRTRARERAVQIRERLWSEVSGLEGVVRTVEEAETLPGTLHLCVEGVASDELLFVLDEAGVCASAGASCSSGASQSSHVLAAMGVESGRARGALRLSFGLETTDADVTAAIAAIRRAHARLREG